MLLPTRQDLNDHDRLSAREEINHLSISREPQNG